MMLRFGGNPVTLIVTRSSINPGFGETRNLTCSPLSVASELQLPGISHENAKIPTLTAMLFRISPGHLRVVPVLGGRAGRCARIEQNAMLRISPLVIAYALWAIFVISWNVADRQTARTIATLGPHRERLYGLVIGDPDRPDLG